MAHGAVRDRRVLTKLAEEDGEEEMGRQTRDRVEWRENEIETD